MFEGAARARSTVRRHRRWRHGVVAGETGAAYLTAAGDRVADGAASHKLWADAGAQVAPGPSLAEALAVVRAAQDLLSRVDLDAEGDRDLLAAAEEAYHLANRQDAVTVRVLGQLNRRGAYGSDGAVNAAAWYRTRAGIDHPTATRAVQAAKRLRSLPALQEAFDEGAVSLSHVAAVTSAAIPRRMPAIAALDDTLTRLARQAPPRQVRMAVQAIKDYVDPDGSDAEPLDDSGSDERRDLQLHQTINGLWQLRGTLDLLTGEALATALDALEWPDPPDTPDRRRRSAGQRRADALGELVNRVLGAGATPTVHGVKPHVLATVDLLELVGLTEDDERARALQTLHDVLGTEAADRLCVAAGQGSGVAIEDRTGRSGRAAGGAPVRRGARARLRFAGGVDPAVIRRLILDASLTIILTMGPWRVVNVGRTMRSLPSWLRTVLQMLHGHCRGPDCDRPPTWADAHHVREWAAGGDTDLNSTVPLCRAHHQFITKGTWTMDYDPDSGACTWTGMDGRVLTTYPRTH